MKKLLSFVLGLCLVVSVPVSAQEPDGDDAPVAFNAVTTKPKFMGKEASEFSRWLAKNIIYPQIALENGIQGRVMVHFVVNKDGSVSDVKLARGVDRNLDKEALRVVSKSPKWTPGSMEDGRSVRVFYVYPVVFSIR